MLKTNKKKKLLIMLFILLLLLLLFKPTTWLGVRIYQGARITVNLHITVDGSPTTVSTDSTTFSLINKKDRAVIKDRANDYDNYFYPLRIETKNENNIPLNIEVRHWNWWEVVKSDLYIDINTATNSYTTYEEYQYTAESQPPMVFYYISKKEEPKQTLESIEEININAGCKG